MSEVRRERLDMDVVVVGAGPAGLSFALRLAQLIRAGQQPEGGRTPSVDNICVLEKADGLGMHILSGAVLDPRVLAELVPDPVAAGAPLETPVGAEQLLWMTERRAWRLPFLPEELRNHGNNVVSVGRLVRWLGTQVQDAGINIITGFSAAEILVEDGRVAGVLTDDKGVDRNGKPKDNFQPGFELRAALVVLAEGAHGSLAKQLTRRFRLDTECNPQHYALGLKEVWELPDGRFAPGDVWHTFGYPLGRRHYGGGWVYGMQDRRVSLGLMSALNYENPAFDPHAALQRFKLHPEIRHLLSGGRLLHYGAKTVPTGGYWAIPRLQVDGALVIGDSAGLFNTLRLKGVHLAIKSGMLAAETAFRALCAGDTSSEFLSAYPEALDHSSVRSELWRARNHHRVFGRGLWHGIAQAALGSAVGWRGGSLRRSAMPGHARMRMADSGCAAGPPASHPDGELTFDKPASVWHSGVRHADDQPSHLRVTDPSICVDRCVREFGNPCQYFCPAGVYEIIDDGQRLKVNSENCLHCKACDIMDPYQIIEWTTPEGGGGPRYEGM